MVRKHNTYSFVNLVSGIYAQGDYSHLASMVAKMTIEERGMALARNFEYMWRRVWMDTGHRGYLSALRKYEVLMAESSRFTNLLKNVQHCGQLRWEVPKGKKNSNDESELQAAVREFREETGIKIDQFRIFPDVVWDDSYVDEGVRYTTRYFGAVGNFEPDKMHRHLNETSDVRWMDLEELRVTDRLGYSHMASIVRPMVRRLRREIPRS